MVWLVWVSVASAEAPSFTGSPADVALAGRIWAAAIACTGWEPEARPIAITHVPTLPSGFDGLARWGDDGVREILLLDGAPSVVLAHEVGHVWFHGDGAALDEGRAEVLAECVAGALPQDLRFLRADDYVSAHLEDLRGWTDAFAIEDRVNSAQYTGAWRFFRIVDSVVAGHAVLGPALHTWDDVLALLDANGPDGHTLADVVRGGVERQRAALDDADLDGLVTLHESILGLDPSRWDSDGDGWWDGAPAPEARPPGAVPLRHDAAAVCIPRVPSGPLEVEFGGRVRGMDAQVSARARGRTNGEGAEIALQSVFRAPEVARARGGYWVAPRGQPTGGNPRCSLGAAATVVDRSAAAPRGLEAFAAEIAVAQGAVARLVGPASRRTLVVVGTDASEVRVPAKALTEVTVEVPDAVWQHASDRPEDLAALAWHVAVLQRLVDSGAWATSDPAMANALREDLQGVSGPIFGTTWRGEVKGWHRTAEKCASWRMVLDQDCP